VPQREHTVLMELHAEVQNGDIVLPETKNPGLYTGLQTNNLLQRDKRIHVRKEGEISSVIVDGDEKLTQSLNNLTQLTLAVRKIHNEAIVVLSTAHQKAPGSVTGMKQVYPPNEQFTGDDVTEWLNDPSDVGERKSTIMAAGNGDEHLLTSMDPPSQ